MTVIVVANPKGGVGKSTLSTQIAAYFAAQGRAVSLGDLDPQRSASAWLSIRPDTAPHIQPWNIDVTQPSAPPTADAVIDTPAGLEGERRQAALALADKVLVPVLPSIFDIYAIKDFIDALKSERAVKRGRIDVAVIGMRVDGRTRAADQLQRFVDALEVPVLGNLRDTQNYIQLAAHGLSLWDVSNVKIDKDVEQWAPLIAWLEG